MKKIEKLNYKKMLKDILKLVDTDFCAEMRDKIGLDKYKNEESEAMAKIIAEVYGIAHCLYCSACAGKYKTEDQKLQEGEHIEAYKSVFSRHEVADNLQAQWEAGRDGVNNVDKLFELTEELHKQGCKDLEKAYIKDLKVKPEKQEDWRDRIQSFSLGVSESFKIDGEYIDSKEELVAFISQLLSERTFNQKELGILDNIGEELFLRGYEYSDEEIEVLQKLSKLLNNNNEKDRKANTHKHR